MKTWLRLTLITVTVGGGFTGIAVTLQALFSPQAHPLAYFLILVCVGLYVFVTASGLIFVHDPQRTSPLIVALALQVPWVSSPLIAYKFAAGFHVTAGLVSGQFSGGFRFGCDFQINFFQQLPWGAGVNLFALALLVLALHATRMPKNVRQPTAAALGISAPLDNPVPPASTTPPAEGSG